MFTLLWNRISVARYTFSAPSKIPFIVDVSFCSLTRYYKVKATTRLVINKDISEALQQKLNFFGSSDDELKKTS